MEEMACLWSYQESVDELKQKLLCTTLELEQLKMESAEEVRKSREYTKQLLQLVEFACKERDEARDQLQMLLNKVMPSPTNVFPGLPSLQPDDSPLLKPSTTMKANSCITESNSHGSPPCDSYFDAVSSPDFSNANADDSRDVGFVNPPLVRGCEGNMANNMIPSGMPNIDQAGLVIDSIVKGKPLPQKGKLLKAVLDAGPLLQNLLVAGPLPRWRNPPQVETFHIPPVSIKGCDIEVYNGKIGPNLSPIASRSMASRPYAEVSCSSQILTTSVVNYGNGAYGSCLGSDRLIAAGSNANGCVPLGKRQRLS